MNFPPPGSAGKAGPEKEGLTPRAGHYTCVWLVGDPPVARRMLPAAAVLVFLACLTIAAVWNATESARAADQVRRSSTTLVQLATLRAAIAEARVTPSSEETRTRRSPGQRARRAIRTLNRLHQGRPDESAIFDRLEGMVRERTSRRTSVAPDRVALLDREIERL